MARAHFKLPDLGEGIAESEIAEWRVAVGDKVSEDQPLVDMLTDKAAVEIPSPVAGTVLELHGEPGDRIAVGSVLLVIDVANSAVATDTESASDGVEVSTAGAKDGTPEAAAEQGSVETASPDSGSVCAAGASSGAGAVEASGDGQRPGHVLAAPAVRRRAAELGIDLTTITGSGPDRRITHHDLDVRLLQRAPGRPAAPAMSRREVETVKIIGRRRAIAEAMQKSAQQIPHFAYVEEVDVTTLEALRRQINDAQGTEGRKLSVLPFLVRALVQVLPQHPQINATYDTQAGELRRYTAVHCGIATQTDDGLLVPVLRDADTLDLWQIADGIGRLAESARTGRLARDELRGSTITLSSLGALGGIVSTPIINAPEVAIVGVNRIVERPVYREGRVQLRLMMNLSSSFDHRIVDGFDAATFIHDLKAALEHPAPLLAGPR